MTVESQLRNVLDSYGSYKYLCVTDGKHPFWAHERHGRVLHVVSDAERALQAERGLR